MSRPERRAGMTGLMWTVIVALWLIFSGAAVISTVVQHSSWSGLIEIEGSYALVTGLGVLAFVTIPWRRQ